MRTKPMPIALARIAVLMPITSPNSLSSGPPEFPGLMAASVCMKLTFLLGMPTSAADRDREETMPSVTVESSPTALPIAITQSPTCSSSDRPSGAVGSTFPDGLMRTAARSMYSSDPESRLDSPWTRRASASTHVGRGEGRGFNAFHC